MGRKCPVCGKGMFRPKKLKEHIRRHHPDYYYEHIYTGISRTDEERKKKMEELSRKKKKERLKKFGIEVDEKEGKKK